MNQSAPDPAPLRIRDGVAPAGERVEPVVTLTGYTPGALQPRTTYFWRVVERNTTGTTPGPT